MAARPGTSTARLATEHFPETGATAHPELDLTISLRSRRADHLHDWVRDLLDGRLAAAARQAAKVQAEAFPMYLTRSLDDARAYTWSRYEGEPEVRYGLIASSRSSNFLPKFGVDNSWVATQKIKLARWFNKGRGHPQSCCELKDVVTEFQCQGLELDLPIIYWGSDFRWTGTAWHVRPVKSQYPIENPEQIRRNAYRVLLTRGRDGLVIFIPPDESMDLTEHALLAAGVRPLPEAVAVGGAIVAHLASR